MRILPIQLDESLSSWLIRIAQSHYCEPNIITWQAWGDRYRPWTIYFERNLSDERVKQLAETLDVSTEQIDNALLLSLAKLHSSHVNVKSGNWEWIMSQGMRNRKKSVGQAFCSLCFNSDKKPYLRRKWRTAWATTCTKHNVLLQDQCPKCRCYFLPSRLKNFEKKLSFCHNCKQDLGKINFIEATSKFQILAEEAILSKESSYNGQTLSSVEWFESARAFTRILRKVANSPNSRLALATQETINVPSEQFTPTSTGGVFEWLPLGERHSILSQCHKIMEVPLDKLIEISQSYKVSKNAYYHAMEKQVPKSLQPLLNSLPSNNRSYGISHNKSTPKSETSVMRQWARLQRKVDREIRS